MTNLLFLDLEKVKILVIVTRFVTESLLSQSAGIQENMT